MKNDFKQVLDRQLSSLAWDENRSQKVLRQVRGETKVKKKMSFSLVMAMALVLVAGIAIAAVTLSRAPQVDAINQAREALIEKYGMTPAALGVFFPKASQEGKEWKVQFIGGGLPEGLVGEYTVLLSEGQAPKASWSHDDADKALLDSGKLESPAWGVKQIQKALTDTDAKEAAIKKHLQANPELIKYAEGLGPTPPVEKPQDGDRYYGGAHMREAQPEAKHLSREKALEIAKAAIVEDLKVSQATLDKAEMTHAVFLKAVEGDKTTWTFAFYVVEGGVEMGLGVSLDGESGEIINIGISTGGNG